MSTSHKPHVAVIDYGMGNMFSIKRACEHEGLCPVIAHDKPVLMAADAAILPGVGAFGDAMDRLTEMGLVGPIREFIALGKPFFGICLGMQLLMSGSEEFGRYEGLNIIKGPVVRFRAVQDADRKIKVPQVGWNWIDPPAYRADDRWGASPLKGLKRSECMYFVHSYYAVPEDRDVVLSITGYGGTEYCSSMLWKNVFACQFHPEKSGSQGLAIYRNWASTIKRQERISL